MSHSTHLPSDPEVYAGHGFPKKPDTIQASPQQAPQNTSKNCCFLVREDFMGKSIRFFEVPFKALMAVAAAIAFLGLPPSSSAHIGFPHCLRHPRGQPYNCLGPGGSMNPGGITGLTFCNKSSYSNIKVAYGATDFENDWYSKGYWTLVERGMFKSANRKSYIVLFIIHMLGLAALVTPRYIGVAVTILANSVSAVIVHFRYGISMVVHQKVILETLAV